MLAYIIVLKSFLYILSTVPQMVSKTFPNSSTRSKYFEATNFGVWLEIQLESLKNYEKLKKTILTF